MRGARAKSGQAVSLGFRRTVHFSLGSFEARQPIMKQATVLVPVMIQKSYCVTVFKIFQVLLKKFLVVSPSCAMVRADPS